MRPPRSHFRFVTGDANSDTCRSHQKIVHSVRTKTGALLVRCTDEEAEQIRRASKSERRTLSDYILNAVLSRIEARERLLREADNRLENPKAPLPHIPRQV